MTSLRGVPPAYGSLTRMASPGFKVAPSFAMAVCTVQGIGTTWEPMSSDCATTWLSGAKRPQEKSLAS